jgi:hypothetical protein
MANKPVDIFWGLMEPPIFLLLAASYLPRTILNLVLAGQFRAFISPSLFKDAWFATFWSVMGPSTREGATLRAEPLIAQAHGVVLDIGPGSGTYTIERHRAILRACLNIMNLKFYKDYGVNILNRRMASAFCQTESHQDLWRRAEQRPPSRTETQDQASWVGGHICHLPSWCGRFRREVGWEGGGG